MSYTITAERDRLIDVLGYAEAGLNIGQVNDTEALRRAFDLDLVERDYTAVPAIMAMFNLPCLRLTDAGFDYLSEIAG